MAIKTAILGYGRNGSTMHAGPIQKLDEFEMVAVCDIDKEARENAAKRFDCVVYEDYKQMLEQEELDLVVIVTRSSQHCQMACDCLRAGKNVLVTKPWAVNADQAKKMIKAANESSNKLLPWLPARWGSQLIRLKEIIAAGAIGEVFQIRRNVHTFGTRTDWQTLKSEGGGYLLNWGPHIVDMAMQLIDADVISAYANMKQVINPGDVEDVFFATLRTSDDITIVAEHAISCAPMPSWVVQGDGGSIIVEDNKIKTYSAKVPNALDPNEYRNKVEITTEIEDVEGAEYGDEFEIYKIIAKGILGERDEYPVSCESALRLSEIFDAIRLSGKVNIVTVI